MTVGSVYGWDSVAHDSGFSLWMGQCSTWQWVQFVAGTLWHITLGSMHGWDSAADDRGFSSWPGKMHKTVDTWGVLTGQWKLCHYISHPGGSHHLMSMKALTGFCPLTWTMQQYEHIRVLCAHTNEAGLPWSALSSVTQNIVSTGSTKKYSYCTSLLYCYPVSGSTLNADMAVK